MQSLWSQSLEWFDPGQGSVKGFVVVVGVLRRFQDAGEFGDVEIGDAFSADGAAEASST